MNPKTWHQQHLEPSRLGFSSMAQLLASMQLSWLHADQGTVSYLHETAINQHLLLRSLQASMCTGTIAIAGCTCNNWLIYLCWQAVHTPYISLPKQLPTSANQVNMLRCRVRHCLCTARM